MSPSRPLTIPDRTSRSLTMIGDTFVSWPSPGRNVRPRAASTPQDREEIDRHVRADELDGRHAGARQQVALKGGMTGETPER